MLLVLIEFFIMPMMSWASEELTYEVDLIQNLDPEHVDDGPVRHRVPSKHIVCNITRKSIDIPGVNPCDIYMYEVMDVDGIQTAAFTKMSDFIEYIFNSEESVMIRLHIDGYSLNGYIFLCP